LAAAPALLQPEHSLSLLEDLLLLQAALLVASAETAAQLLPRADAAAESPPLRGALPVFR
jgi:hypothetical protein